jgi:hypothetical protein
LNDSLKVDSDLKLFREVLCHENSSSNVDVELFNHDVSVINSSEITVTRNPNIHLDVCNVENCSDVPHCNVYGGSLWVLAELNGVKCPLMLTFLLNIMVMWRVC